MTATTRPDVAQILNNLKDFQRDTVDYVHQRFWLDDDPARRFLVADEVGLGKTMVARGVIARTLDHLWDRENVDRIDIVYICSNGQIARQNISRLNITGDDLNHADRLTLLGKHVADLRKQRVNVVSFTPGTSFAISDASGRVDERALIYALLRRRWGRAKVSSNAWLQFFRDAASAESFQRSVANVSKNEVDDDIAATLDLALQTQRYDDDLTLGEALDECVAQFRYLREGSTVDIEVRRMRARLIGRMRAVIASAAIASLRPSLVILDEFQRFKRLLNEDDPTARLAHDLFEGSENTRVLMLSATPYKMYTLPDEAEGDDHYEDFEATIGFLAGKPTADAVGHDLALMRRAVFDPSIRESGKQARDRAEANLRRCMSRTERLASTPDRDGMLKEQLIATKLTPADVLAYRTAQFVSDQLKQGDILEYWRSTPYPLSLMDNYQLKAQFKAAVDRNDPELATLLKGSAALLDWEEIEQYKKVDAGNAKLRALTEDVIDRGAWKLLWLPPALPYYSLGGDYSRPELATFTKRLVFSAWNVVPKAIATLMSYDAERAAATRIDDKRTRGEIVRPLLNFSRTSGRLSGMPLLAMLYPSPALARLGDPLAICRWADEVPVPRGRFESRLRDQVQGALDTLPPGPQDGPIDQSWYWAVPFLLDRGGVDQDDFLRAMSSWGNIGDDDAEDESAQSEHVREAIRVDPTTLGRRPVDLAQVVALLASAGPGNVALRALHRVSPELALKDVDLRRDATTVSWAVRSLFNQPQATDIVRFGTKEAAYWRAVLNHCYDGCLQAVMDEWVHVLTESEGKQVADPHDRSERLAGVIEASMTLRRTSNAVDDFRVNGDRISTTTPRPALNTHFAVRFGRDASDTEAVQDRERAVRNAYNSPFWPFVLASTSVGQEGLDFHLYSHAVVHWNLPSNPVDLEQREGRVHRYKNHAVRKNVAKVHARAILTDVEDDPWRAVFAAAHDSRPDGASDLVPYWIFTTDGGAVIERYVPALPLSQEMARYRRLQRTVGAYRLAFGQPRQEDLLSYAAGTNEDLSWLRIDLMPPAR